MQEAVKIYLLREIAGLTSMTPAQLAEAAACFGCYDARQAKMVELYLLCQATNA